MKRTFLIKILIFLMLSILSAFLFMGCKGEQEHVHAFDRQTVKAEYLKSDATCTEKAIYYKSCECGEKGTETFISGEVLGHSYGEWISNGDGTHKKVCENDNSHSQIENCNGGQATCKEKAICKDCGAQYGSLLQHQYVEVVDDKYKVSDATCSEKAVYYKSCACGEKGTETFTSGEVAPCEYVDGFCKWCQTEYRTWQEIASEMLYDGEKTIEINAGISPSTYFMDLYMGANFNKYYLVIPAKLDTQTGLYVPSYSEQDVINRLVLCEQKGIDVQIFLHRNLVRPNYNVFRDTYGNIDFKDYPAFKGFYMIDEPTWNQIGVLEDEYVDWFNENYGIEACGGQPKYEFYVNFTAGYSTLIGHVLDENGNAIYDIDPVTGNTVDCLDPVKQEAFYDRYINRYITNVLSKLESANKEFSIDTYALMDNQKGKVIIPSEEYRKLYVETYGIADENILIAGNMPDGYQAYLLENWLYRTNKGAITAKNNSVNFASCILTADESGSRTFRLPTSKADVTWQLYMNLAFGAKKLVCYGYDQYDGGSYMTAQGKPLPLYYLVQEANAEILKIGKVMSEFDKWVGVKTFVGTGKQKNSAFSLISQTELKSLTGVSNVVCSNDLVIGEMIDKNGNHGYMLVGYQDPYNNGSTTVEMTFDGADGLIIYRGGERTLSEPLVDGKFNVTFGIGEGVFVIPIYENSHMHFYNVEKVDVQYLKTESSCSEKAVYYKSCACGEKGTETFTSGEVLPCNYDFGRCTTCNKRQYERQEYSDLQSAVDGMVFESDNKVELGAYISPSKSFLDTYLGANFNRYTIVIPAKKNTDTNEYTASMTEQKIIETLTLCEQKGIDVQIQLHHNLLRSGYNVFRDSYPNLDLKDYPAFKGFFICDEPSWKILGVIETEYVEWFNQNYGIDACGGQPKYEFYVNFLSDYSTALGHVLDQNGTAIYDFIKDENGDYNYENGEYVKVKNGTGEYKKVDCLDPVKQEAFYDVCVERYMDILDSVESINKYFTVSGYPLKDNQPSKVIIPSEEYREIYVDEFGIDDGNILIAGDMPDDYESFISENYLYDRYKAGMVATKNSIKFGAYILTCDETSANRNFRLPTSIYDVKWQAYMNLAFGAKRLVCYGYDQSVGGTYMTLKGQPLPLYDYVKETNAEIQKISDALCYFERFVGVKSFVGTGKNTPVAFEKIKDLQLKSLFEISKVQTDNDLIIGEMQSRKGDYGYVIVGYDDPYNNATTNITLTFKDADGIILYRGGEKNVVELDESGTFDLTLGVGEGVFVVPVYTR